MRTLVVGVLAALTLTAEAHAEGRASRSFQPKTPTSIQQALAEAQPALQFRARGQERARGGARCPCATQHTGQARLPFGGGVRHFFGSYRGLPVLGAGASVQVDVQGRALAVFHAGSVRWPGSLTPRVDRDQAQTIFWQQTQLAIPAERMQLGLYLRQGQARLAWFGYPEMPLGLPRRVRLVLDAELGQVLQARDLGSTVRASVYPTNPIRTPTLQSLELPLAESAPDTLSGPFLQARNCVDRKTVRDTPYNLRMHVCDLEDSASLEDGEYRLTPNDTAGDPGRVEDAFAQVSIYYHAARATRFFQELQGDASAHVAHTESEPLHAVANVRLPPGLIAGNYTQIDNPEKPLDAYNNAYFAPGGSGDAIATVLGVATGDGLYFGQRAEFDYSYDGDVVYHEFTHAVIEKTLGLEAYTLDEYGASVAPGAMNEGLADYFSAAISGDPVIADYASADNAGSRVLDNQRTCHDVSGESHLDSQIFSGALWKTREQLPEASRAVFDASLYQTMLTHADLNTPSYEELLDLFSADLSVHLPVAAPLLQAQREQRGLAPKCTRILEQSAGPLTQSELGAFLAPGTYELGVSRVPGVMQVHYVFSTPIKSLRAVIGSPRTSRGDRVFAPKLLVRFGAPIRWTTGESPQATADQEIEVEADRNGEQSFELTAPAGSTEVYLQVVNDGAGDGSYSSLGIRAEAEPAPSPDPSEDEGDDDDGTNGAKPTNGDTEHADDEGCGCRHASGEQPLGALGLWALGLLFWRRRRA